MAEVVEFALALQLQKIALPCIHLCLWSYMKTLPILSLLMAATIQAQTPLLTRDALIQDARVLVRTLEEAHPDPYTAFGGRIGFHRAFQEKLRAIPGEGMTVQAFYNLWAPFLARLEDGHTRLRPGGGAVKGPGLPWRFKVVGTELVALDGDLRGSRLDAVGGLPLAHLRDRLRELRGCENASGELMVLQSSLSRAGGLQELLPNWQQGTVVEVRFRRPDGSLDIRKIAPGEPAKTASQPSRVQGLPDPSRGSLAWNFLDAEGHTAVLSIRDCVNFRENVPLYLGMPNGQGRTFLEASFAKRHGRKPKDDVELKASFPSALETFAELARAMKSQRTRTLLVDLRDNDGGNSLLGYMLVYVLHGPEGLRKLGASWSLTRYSQLLIENYGEQFRNPVDEGLPLKPGDYNFQEERQARLGAQAPEAWREPLEMLPDLAAECKSLSCAGIYPPPRIVALTTPETFSAGFDAVLALRQNGAKVAGTPSGQAPNCFIDGLSFTLPRTGLAGTVSFKAQFSFPPGTPEGRMLPCDLPLTYEKFKALNFDPNAEILLALEGE